MRGFLFDVERAEAEYRQEVEAIKAKLGVHATYSDTPAVMRYSAATQLFAAITVDALISLYVVLKYGGENHDKVLRMGSTEKRLKAVFAGVGKVLPEDAEIFRLLRDIATSRHRIAHPHSAEYVQGRAGKSPQPDRPWSDDSGAAAREAVQRVDRVIQLLMSLDEECAVFFSA